MAKYFYIYSNGRCGTQFIARHLGQLAETETIVHEAIPLAMDARRVFRIGDGVYDILGRSPVLQRHFIRVENFLRRDSRYVNCGWPTFAWLPYLQERFGADFGFVHLVRNPYVSAASHSTHQQMGDVNPDRISKSLKLYASDPRVVFGQFKEKAAGFNIYERQLFHWLELTQFGLEMERSSGFEGRYRFEDLVGENSTQLNEVLTKVMGRDVTGDKAKPFDRVHRTSIWPIEFSLDPELRAEVDKMAQQLGYSEAELMAASDPVFLSETYEKQRLPGMPNDHGVPVVEPKKKS